MRQSKYERAVELGVENKRGVELLTNHCRNARVDLGGGTSMVGQMLDPPIGMAQVRCEHADKPRRMAMQVMDLAVEFYEANCVGCPHQQPNGLLPTIASRAEDRRHKAEQAAADVAAVRQAALDAWGARRLARRLAVATEGYPARDLATELDLLDPHPDADPVDVQRAEAAHRRVMETARRAPEVFTRPLVQVLMDLALSRLNGTACAALRVLARSGVAEPTTAADTAARVLAIMPIPEAGQTIAEFASEIAPEALKAALPNVISLAAHHDDFLMRQRTPEPAALLAISVLNLPATTEAIIHRLADDNEMVRAEAADAAAVLLRVDSRRVVALGSALAQSIRGEDEGYAGTPHPAAAAARAFAEAWRGSPDVTVALIEREAPALSEDARGELFRVIRFLRRWDDDTPVPDAAAATAAAFLVRRLGGDWGGRVPDRASDELLTLASHHPEAVLPQTDAVLAALLALCTPESNSPLFIPEALTGAHSRKSQRRWSRWLP